ADVAILHQDVGSGYIAGVGVVAGMHGVGGRIGANRHVLNRGVFGGGTANGNVELGGIGKRNIANHFAFESRETDHDWVDGDGGAGEGVGGAAGCCGVDRVLNGGGVGGDAVADCSKVCDILDVIGVNQKSPRSDGVRGEGKKRDDDCGETNNG